MELKYVSGCEYAGDDASSNRTFMELKSPGSIEAHQEGASSNRTFMELKWEKTGQHCQGVLF